MAEVRLCFGRRVCDFSHKTCIRNLSGSQKKRSKGAREASRLSAGFLLEEDIRNSKDDAADTYARGPSTGEAVRDEENLYFKTYSPNHIDAPRCRRAAVVLGSFPSPRLLRQHAWIYQNIRVYSSTGPRAEPLYKTKTGYYEVLDVPPTATQTQIKTAYYKQSFIYHPDRNSGSDEATTRFSEISEAYAVLGSIALRKKYDRGLLSLPDLTATARPSAKDYAGSPVKPQPGSGRSVAGQHAGGGVFDFDTFYKSHYSEQLQRQRGIRLRKEEMLREKREAKGAKHKKMMEMALGLLLATGLGIFVSLKRD